ncbi:hypothetical protein TNCV_2439961 [Trichonephila clavipes]|nr:hypothetical protein TNCV_2439961 [Trichonephila clavipes]
MCTKTRPVSSSTEKGDRRADAVDVVVTVPHAPRRGPDSRVVSRRKKGDEHPPPSGLGRMSLSSFRVHQDATGQQSSASTEKVTNTHRRATAVGCRCHRSACNQDATGQQSSASTEKVTNTHRPRLR